MKHEKLDIPNLLLEIIKSDVLCIEIGDYTKLWYRTKDISLADEGNWFIILKHNNDDHGYVELLFSPYDIDSDILTNDVMDDIKNEGNECHDVWTNTAEFENISDDTYVGYLRYNEKSMYRMKVIQILDRQNIKFKLFTLK